MDLKLKNGIYVPMKNPQDIYVFIDETYLLNNSAFLQSATPIPADLYQQVLIDDSRNLLNSLGPHAKEFKGSKIRPGNVSTYRDFLRLWIDACASVGDQVPLYPIVSFGSQSSYAGTDVEQIKSEIESALLSVQSGVHPELLAEVCRQIKWLVHHFHRAAPSSFTNEMILYFDNKHRYAQLMRDTRAVVGDYSNVVLWSTEKIIRTCLNAKLPNLTPGYRFPNLRKFTFAWSTTQFGLQAADVLSHLIYSGFRYEMGIQDPITETKRELLEEFILEFAIDDALRAILTVGTSNNGKSDVECLGAHISTYQFLPDS